uniref:Putative replicase n=1 Tax=Betsystermes virus TaxID=2796579 RepID=A0A7T7K8S5_9VIRU|nr:putative replicase [Betsystermes virus]
MNTSPSEPGGNTAITREKAKSSSSVRVGKSIRSVLHLLMKAGQIADSNSLLRLHRWLTREANGSNVDLRSPFFSAKTEEKGKSVRIYKPRDEIIRGMWEVMKSVDLKDLPVKFRELIITTEESQASSIGPQSPYLPFNLDMEDKISAVYSDKPRSDKLNDRALQRAIDRVSSLLPSQSIGMTPIEVAINASRVNPRDIDDEGMDVTTNSGLPYVKSPWKPTSTQDNLSRRDSQLAYEEILSRSANMLESLKQGIPYELWAIAAKRLTQKGSDWRKGKGYEKRKRLVIALEKCEPVIWKTFTPKLLYDLSHAHVEFCALLDLPRIDEVMQTILSKATGEGRTVLGGDYSGYDASLPPWLIQVAGDIIGNWVAGGQTIVSTLTNSMINCVNLVTPNRIWRAQPSSMKSGSGGTNLLDSVCNLVVIYYGEEIGNYKVQNCAVQGDDFVVDAIGIDPVNMSEVASLFGLNAHPDKQMFEFGALSFLQKLHFHGYIGGVASVMRTLGSILSYEKLMVNPKLWNSSADIIRARQQLDNCVFNPFYESLIGYVKEGDRYNLGGQASPKELLEAAGPAGLTILHQAYGALSKTVSEGVDVRDQFKISAVNRVLKGEVVPPLGSQERFIFAYGKRA